MAVSYLDIDYNPTETITIGSNSYDLDFRINIFKGNQFMNFSCSGGFGNLHTNGLPRVLIQDDFVYQGGDSSNELLTYFNSYPFSRLTKRPDYIGEMMQLNTNYSQYMCAGMFKFRRTNWVKMKNFTV